MKLLLNLLILKIRSEFSKYLYKLDGDVILFCYVRFKRFEEKLIRTPKDKTLINFGSDILQYEDLVTYPFDHQIFQTIHQKIFFYGFFSHRAIAVDSSKPN